MPKFFVNNSNIQNSSIKITGEDVNHIKKVLRLRIGDKIVVSDSTGFDFRVQIEEYEQDCIRTEILNKTKNLSEPPLDVILYQGMPKSDKMDFIIQKSIELGIKRVVPVITEHTVVRVEGKKDVDNKCTRWRRIALEAAKQCNRGIIPEVDAPVSFRQALELSTQADLRIIPYEKEIGNRLKNCLLEGNVQKVSLFIGPEGGFSEKEIEEAVFHGIKPVTLGPRILRTETAGIAVLSILMYELGDVG